MEDKIFEARFKKNPLVWIIIIVGLIAIVGGYGIGYYDYLTGTDYDYMPFYGYVEAPNTEVFSSFGKYWGHHSNPFDNFQSLMVYAGVFCILCGLIMTWLMNACSLTITSNHVIGKASFGKRVDLPISQISAVALGSFDRITIATSSGKIHFWLLSNREEVHEELNRIIGKVQVEAAYNHNSTASVSNAEELKKYKELLDSGVISQEEFDAKKKQLLSL